MDAQRPVESPDDPSAVSNACESAPYRIQENVAHLTQFWIKGQPYLLTHMMQENCLVSRFVGGTMYYLSSIFKCYELSPLAW